MKNCDDPKYQRQVNEDRIQRYLFVGFLARLSTKVCTEIQNHYGQEFLQELIEQFKTYAKAMEPHCRDMTDIVNRAVIESNGDRQLLNRASYDRIPLYWEEVSDKTLPMGYIVQRWQKEALEQGKPFNIEEHRQVLIDVYGEFLVLPLIDHMSLNVEFSQECLQLIHDGHELLNNRSVSEREITSFEAQLLHSAYSDNLGWIVSWLKGKHAYRLGNIQDAYDLFDETLQKGKYSAGSNIDRLLYEYLLVAVKINKEPRFKKALAWAYFLELDVWWLRGFENTDDQIKSMFKAFKNMDASI